MRLIDANKLLKELSKSSTVSKVDVQIIVSNMPGVEAVPMDYHERCMGLVEQQKIKLAKALGQERRKTADMLEQCKAIAAEHPYKVSDDWDTYSEYNEGWTDACYRIMSMMEGAGNHDQG